MHGFLCVFVGLCELVHLLVFVSACGSIGMYTSVFECVPVYIYIMFVSVCVSLYMSVSSGASRSDFLFVCISVCVIFVCVCVYTRGLRMPPVGGIWLLDMFGLALPVFSTS